MTDVPIDPIGAAHRLDRILDRQPQENPVAAFKIGDQVRERHLTDGSVRTITGVVEHGPAAGFLYLDGGTRNGLGPVDPIGYVRTDLLKRNPDGTRTRTIRVQRACNGCGQRLRQITDEEAEAAVNGLPLPEVTDECLTCTPPAPDFRVRLVAELLGEDRQDAADLLAEDPDATWEKAYAVWSLESAELERYRRDESPVLDRVAQLERDMGAVEQRVNNLYASDGVLARLDALELAERERAQSGGAPRATVTGGGFTEATDT